MALYPPPPLLACLCGQSDLEYPKNRENLHKIDWKELTLGKTIGEGASGTISQASIKGESLCAIKIFKGEVTSDGYPADEMAASMRAGEHTHLNTPYAKIINHPQDKEALIFRLIPPLYCPLGNPPDFQTCTRDTYEKNRSFALDEIVTVALGIANAVHCLHQKGISHGDLYAHNILINQEAHALLGDFGAATLYDRTDFGEDFERLEARAFGCLLEDLLLRAQTNTPKDIACLEALERLTEELLSPIVAKRALFDELIKNLNAIAKSCR